MLEDIMVVYTIVISSEHSEQASPRARDRK